MHERTLLVASFAILGCETNAQPAEDAGIADGDAVSIVDAGPACPPISGSARFGVQLKGDVTYDDPSVSPRAPTSIFMTLLFPRGRVPGAPVTIVGGFGPGSATSTLDASLGATGLRIYEAHCVHEIDAILAGPSDGLIASVKYNLQAPTDGITIVTGHVKLCATGPFPPSANATVTAPTQASPLGEVLLRPSLPFDPATIESAKALASGSVVPIRIATREGHLSIAPIAAFPPAAKSVTFDLSGVRDLFGRSFVSPAPLLIVVPSGALVSRTFDEAPPDDAMFLLGTPQTKIESGAFWIETERKNDRNFQALLGLGSEAGAKTIRFRHRFDCADVVFSQKRIALVASDGAIRELKVDCSATFIDESVPLPGTQPSYLQIDFGFPPEPIYCSGPTRSSRGAYVIDELAFAP